MEKSGKDTISANDAMHYVPTLKERFWKFLGFNRYYHKDKTLEEFDVVHVHWMMTTCYVRVSFADRLRILVSGFIQFDLRQYANVKVDSCKSYLSLMILSPSYKPIINKPKEKSDGQ